MTYDWEEVRNEDLPPMVVGQISEIERRMLYYIASEKWRGMGEVVEIGSLYGKSTTCLAHGMDASKVPVKDKRLYAFDLWEWSEETGFMLQQMGKSYRGDFFGLFLENTRPWDRYIIPMKGDLFKMQWSGRPIEILFIDCSLSHEFHEMLFKKFFRSLVPGAFVIHQDYFLHRSYYLPPMMAKLADYMAVVGCADTSVVLRLVRPIPDELFEQPLLGPESEFVPYIEDSIPGMGGLDSDCGAIYATMLIYYYIKSHRPEMAEPWRLEIMQKPRSDCVMQNLKFALEAA